MGRLPNFLVIRCDRCPYGCTIQKPCLIECDTVRSVRMELRVFTAKHFRTKVAESAELIKNTGGQNEIRKARGAYYPVPRRGRHDALAYHPHEAAT